MAYFSLCDNSCGAQVILKAIMDLLGAEMVPQDSIALLNGLVDAQAAPEIALLQRVHFPIPTFKVCGTIIL